MQLTQLAMVLIAAPDRRVAPAAGTSSKVRGDVGESLVGVLRKYAVNGGAADAQCRGNRYH